MATVAISSRDTVDNVKVSAAIDYSMPESLAQAIELYTEPEVFKLFSTALTLAVQGPARKELVAQWDSLPEEERLAMTLRPTDPEGVPTGALPAVAQQALQEAVSAWKLGDRPTRTRTARVPRDTIKDLMDDLKEGKIAPERLEELQALVAQMFPPKVGSRNRG